MKILSKGTIAHLHGGLTHSGVTYNIVNTLAASLEKLGSGGEKSFYIDCGKVLSADVSGLQLLYVWIQCAKFKGVEAILVILPERLKQDMQRIELGHCFVNTSASS